MDLSFHPLTLEAIDQAAAESLCLFIAADERPLTGLAGLADWRLSGRLSRLLRGGLLTGEAGEAVLTPPGARMSSFRKLFLFGIGKMGQSDEQLAQRVAEALHKLEQAGVHEAALQLPARLPIETGVRTLIDSLQGPGRAMVFGPEPQKLVTALSQAASRGQAQLERRVVKVPPPPPPVKPVSPGVKAHPRPQQPPAQQPPAPIPVAQPIPVAPAVPKASPLPFAPQGDRPEPQFTPPPAAPKATPLPAAPEPTLAAQPLPPAPDAPPAAQPLPAAPASGSEKAAPGATLAAQPLPATPASPPAPKAPTTPQPPLAKPATPAPGAPPRSEPPAPGAEERRPVPPPPQRYVPPPPKPSVFDKNRKK